MWEEKDGSLYKLFEFKDFKHAFALMQKVAVIAEELNHHPKWTNQFNKVKIWLSTHDAGDKVTDKDSRLAEEIDRVYENA